MKILFSILLLPLTLLIGVIKGILKLFLAVLGGLRLLIRGGPARLIGGRSVFNEALFTYFGLIAKSDGRVSELDIAKTEALFKRMRLDADAKASAKRYFKVGAQPGFNPTNTGAVFKETYGKAEVPRRVLLVFLIGFAQSSHGLDESEKAALYAIAEALALSPAEVDRIIDSLSAGEAFRGPTSRKNSRDKLKAAHRIIGVAEKASNKELKAAYRKLVSIHHPDKAIAKNLPEEAVAQANNRMQEITDAYESIKTARGLAN